MNSSFATSAPATRSAHLVLPGAIDLSSARNSAAIIQTNGAGIGRDINVRTV